MKRLLIVSNRLPVTIRRRGGRPVLTPSDGGLATGLGAFHAKRGGLWLGWPGDAAEWSPHQWACIDAELTEQGLVPISLGADEVRGYYAGFSTGVLWPLCHYLVDRIPLDSYHWNAYQDVNRRFADDVARLHQPGDLIWVNDYHLMLVPAMVRARIPDARIAYFHHIPFPSIEVFRALPWRRPLLEGVLGADLIGLHTDSYVQHLRAAFRHTLGAEGGHHDVEWQGRSVVLGAYPMGIDAATIARVAARPAVRKDIDRIRHEAGGRAIMLGVDRLDYTKGIPRRLVAFERLLSRDPSLRDRVRLIQVAVPSRGNVAAYRTFRRDVEALVGRINGQFGTVEAAPVHYLHRTVSQQELTALYGAADVMIVSPLRDGMNLVAKEFVAARTGDDGVLILSEFAGASEDLREAISVNPYDIEGFADAMLRAIGMREPECQARMRALRQRVFSNPVERWVSRFADAAERAGRERVRSALPGEPSEAEDAAVLDHVTRLAARADTVQLCVDYDGTLVPFADTPGLAVPDVGLLSLLGQAAATPGLTVHLISGRSRATLQDWFRDSGLSLWAEHGLWHSRDGRTWEATMPVDPQALRRVLPALERVTALTPGSSIEDKGHSIAWHYRLADPDAGPARAHDLEAELIHLPTAGQFDVIAGNMVVEVRPRGVHKGLAIELIRGKADPGTVIVAIGDDVTDEDMFEALHPSGVGICVGHRPSVARHHLRNWQSVRQLLARLARTHDSASPGNSEQAAMHSQEVPA